MTGSAGAAGAEASSVTDTGDDMGGSADDKEDELPSKLLHILLAVSTCIEGWVMLS